MAKKKKNKKRMRAASADRHKLYEASVQAPEADVEFFEKVYKKNFKKPPHLLREDFCGTYALACEWVKNAEEGEREAIGVDLDEPTLKWGEKHNFSKLSAEDQEKITIYQDDVRKVQGKKADIVAAQNFSYQVFKKRAELKEYFKVCFENLKDDGIFIVDLLGGSLVLQYDHTIEEREQKGFTYIWEQEYFNPITAEVLYHIHFKFPDGSKMKKAFTYDWRLWTIPEIRELMEEVGFNRSDVYWEGTDEDSDGGNGIYKRSLHPDNDPAWVSYIVGVKGDSKQKPVVKK